MQVTPTTAEVTTRPQVAWWRAPVGLWRLLRVLVHVLHGLALVYLRWPSLDDTRRKALIAQWSQGVLKAMGLAVRMHGHPHAGAKLVVSNHISWIDIIVINSVLPSRFVSKAEVGDWPVIGRLVTAAGTLYLVRERRRDAVRVLGLMAQSLRDGQTVAVFPEGTTGEGRHLMHLHPNLLQSAIDAEVPIQPLVLNYREPGLCASTAVPYVGDTSLLTSMWWIATARGLSVDVHALPCVQAAHADRRALTDHLQQGMGEALQRALSA